MSLAPGTRICFFINLPFLWFGQQRFSHRIHTDQGERQLVARPDTKRLANSRGQHNPVFFIQDDIYAHQHDIFAFIEKIFTAEFTENNFINH